MIKESFGLIFPSRWFEADPQVVVEAVRFGLPIVALSINSAAPVVEASGAGAVYIDARSLNRAIRTVSAQRSTMSEKALLLYNTRWSRDVWLRDMQLVYKRIARTD